MANLRLNVAANFVSRIVTTGLAFVFIPVYIRFVGIEAYGLVGFFATLQAVFGLLDLGLGVTINRELARLGAGHRRDDQRNLLRTLETVYWIVSITIGLLTVVLAPSIATRWVQAEALSPASITNAIRLMGVVIALQFPWGFYQGGLMGIGRQVFVSATLVGTAIVRSAGAALVLWKVSPTVEAFFAWQLVVSVIQTGLFTAALWRSLPGETAPRFRYTWLREVWAFAAAVTVSSALGTLLTQVDKLMLSRLLSLEEFAYYTLAVTVASVGWLAIVPVNQAFFPRFTTLVEVGREEELRQVYHKGCQALSVLVIPMVAVVAFFSFELLNLWTRDVQIATQAWLIVSLLIAGTAVNGLSSLPGQLQAAAGWPQLVMYTNTIFALLIVPLMIFSATRYGAVGAAAVWVVLNSGYVFGTVPLMHRRLLKGELGRWYFQDLLLPGVSAIAVVGVARLLFPEALPPVGIIGYLGATWLIASLASISSAPAVRPEATRLFRAALSRGRSARYAFRRSH